MRWTWLLATVPLLVACSGQVDLFTDEGQGGGEDGGGGTTSSQGQGGAATSGPGGTTSASTGSGQGGFPAGSSSVVSVGSSGAGGFPSTSSTGTSGMCKTCSQALNGVPGPFCMTSDLLFDDLVICSCQQGCPMECANSCVGQAGDLDCFGCMSAMCQPQLDACLED